MTSPPVQYAVTSDGIRIAYGESGRGRPLVLLPQPINHMSLMWRAKSHQLFFEQLAERFRFVQYDGRGCGLSQRDLAEATSSLDFDHDLQAVVHELDLGRCILFAPQASSHVAIRYAVREPLRVAALILWQALPSYANGDAALMAEMAAHDWERTKVMLAQVFLPGVEMQSSLQLVSQTCHAKDFIRLARAGEDATVEELLRELSVPVLLLYKASAFKRTVEWAQRMATAIPAAQLVFLEDDGDLYGYPRDTGPLMAHLDRFLDAPQVRTAGLRDPAQQRDVMGNNALRTLTPRELEILQLIAGGGTNREIASQLVLSERTIARHITNLYGKLDIRSKPEATAFAIHQGLA